MWKQKLKLTQIVFEDFSSFWKFIENWYFTR